MTAHPARQRLGRPGPGLFRDIVMAPDRELIPEAHPMISIHGEDDAEFLAEARRRALCTHDLRRRGVDHGSIVELHAEGLLGPRPRRRRRETIESERWCSAQPIFLPQLVEDVARTQDARHLEDLMRKLSAPLGLRRYLEEHPERLAERFSLQDGEAPLFDRERDVARVAFAVKDGPGDLWVKAGRLSTHDEDHSLRARVSFGEEGADDASRDEARHRLVAELANGVLPGASALSRHEALWAKLERHAGRPVYGTQHIAYWNAPGGGARFHHDAFASDASSAEDPKSSCGQHGVVYAQLTGSTVWLALSIQELGARTREFVSWIEDGDSPELRADLQPIWKRVHEAVQEHQDCQRELALPDCGVLSTIVNAPEFTGYLTDAGHALVLHAGDVLLLPNHGLDRTAMHSVFCASRRSAYALSVAVRAS